MDYIATPSLQQFTVTQIAVELWVAKDTREELSNFVLSNNENITYNKPAFYDRKLLAKNLLQQITRKTLHLPIPQPLKTALTNHLRLIGNQISTTYAEFFPNETKPNLDFYLSRLRWTPFGTIDKHKTIECFVNEKTVPITERYVLACKYCCTESDDDLWKKLSAEMKDFIVDHPDDHFELIGSWERRKVDLRRLNRAMNVRFPGKIRDRCLTEFFCKDGTSFGNFWLNLSDVDKKSEINSMAEDYVLSEMNCCTDIIFSFVDRMNDTQRTKFFRDNGALIIETLLKDPLRCWREFLEIVRRLMDLDCISGWDFERILETIAALGIEDFADDVAADRVRRNVFRETWIMSGLDLKRYVLRDCRGLIELLVACEDADGIEMIRNDANTDEKHWIECDVVRALTDTPLYLQKEDFGYVSWFLGKLLSSESAVGSAKKRMFFARDFYFCVKFISEGKWGIVDNFVKWAASGAWEANILKRDLASKKGMDICRPWIISGDCSKVDKFISWCFSDGVDKTQFMCRLYKRRLLHC